MAVHMAVGRKRRLGSRDRRRRCLRLPGSCHRLTRMRCTSPSESGPETLSPRRCAQADLLGRLRRRPGKLPGPPVFVYRFDYRSLAMDYCQPLRLLLDVYHTSELPFVSTTMLFARHRRACRRAC